MTPRPDRATASPVAAIDYISIFIEDQCFGLAIEGVHDVFIAHRLTPVPLAPKDILGLLNLRGRVVTAVSLRSRLGLEPRIGADAGSEGAMILGLERIGESYGLVVDSVGEVISVPAASFEPLPLNFDPLWARLCLGVHRLDPRLMVVLDIDAVLDLPALPPATHARSVNSSQPRVTTP